VVTEKEKSEIIVVTAANWNRNFAGAVPVVFKFVRNVLKKINGE